ncbi:MAG: bifunctional precorrin-2 dehydrogenase/sirohydrochlorin ferrochelatase [Chloroflexi bacterium]|nr:bifunctional precorrin-2 dehydrogenase/sirohydrochlorin ferrochelatase [Chloroflexota bacterium]
MKTPFLAALDLAGRACLVVGGGDEATEKTERLLEAGARVTVISPTATEQIDQWAADGRIAYRPRRLAAEEVDDAVAGFRFVVNTVRSDPVLSRRLYQCCEERSILISAYDQPATSNVTMPALVRSGRLQIGIVTGGSSPALARRLREELEALFDGEFAAFVESLAQARRWLASAPIPSEERRAALRQLVADLHFQARIAYPAWFADSSESARAGADEADSSLGQEPGAEAPTTNAGAPLFVVGASAPGPSTSRQQAWGRRDSSVPCPSPVEHHRDIDG